MRLITMRPYGCPISLHLLLCAVWCVAANGSLLYAQERGTNPSAWAITKEMLFTSDNEPRTPEIAVLMSRLEAKRGDGAPVSKKEFLALLKKPESKIVYADILLRYATPRSMENQSKAHVDLSKRLLSEQNQLACIKFLQTQKKHLRKAEKLYHVKQQDIVGILTWESGLGKFTGNYRIFNVFLSQLLYLDVAQEIAVSKIVVSGEANPLRDSVIAAREKRRFAARKADAVNSLVALLRTAKKMKFDPLTVLGSWGGATGYVQFMPYNIRYAVDADGNGLNLKTWPDAIYSVANFLKVQGDYRRDEAGRRRAILRYNRDPEYVTGVMALADTLARQFPGSIH